MKADIKAKKQQQMNKKNEITFEIVGLPEGMETQASSTLASSVKSVPKADQDAADPFNNDEIGSILISKKDY